MNSLIRAMFFKSIGFYVPIFISLILLFLLLLTRSVEAVDTMTTVDSTNTVGQYSSLQIDSSGNPVVSYYYGTGADLRIIFCGNPTCTSGNTITSLDTTNAVGAYNSLQLDATGKPVISYFDSTLQRLKVLHCGNTSCSSGNVITSVDDGGVYSSLQLDATGNPVVSYMYDDGVDQYLKILHCGNDDCTSGNTIEVVDTVFISDTISLQIDSSGRPVVSYYDFVNGDLKILRCGNPACSSGNTIESPDPDDIADDVGAFSSMQLDPITDYPIVSYMDVTNWDLKILHCGDATCSSGNTIETPDSTFDYEFNHSTSLQLDSDGYPVVSYAHVSVGVLDLNILHCGDATCSSGNIINTLPDAGDDYGRFSSLQLDSGGNPVVSSYDGTNSDLMLLHCDDPACYDLTIEFDSATYSVNENGLTLDVIFNVYGDDVTLVGSNTVDVDIVTGGTASGLGVDYTYTDPTTITIVADDYTTLQTKTETITIINDSSVEGNETILLELVNAGVDLDIGPQSTSTVTIVDGDSSSPVIATSNSSGGNVLRRLFLRKILDAQIKVSSFCPYFTNFLVRGNRDGEDNITDVSKLQTFLNERGYKAGYTDGSFGINTEGGLKRWQTAFREQILTVWGIFNPTGVFYQSSRHIANKQVGCTNITTVLDNGVVLQ